jgi:hypothetical protein
MAVIPIFYEEGCFNDPHTKMLRLIRNKHLYFLYQNQADGQTYVVSCTIDADGRLKGRERLDNAEREVNLSINPGSYAFFVSKYALDHPEQVLGYDNCVQQRITEQTKQALILPWPMCYHRFNGAEYVANYILGEIQRNSVSSEVKILAWMHNKEARLAEWLSLPPAQQQSYKILVDMSGEALVIWASLVGPGCVWDHKPDIRGARGNQGLENYSVLRPSGPGKAPTRGVFHKYKNHDYFYDVWSNIHYGYVGKVAGFTDNELLDGAGLAQLISDIRQGKAKVYDKKAFPGMQSFDDLPDQANIKLGIRLFQGTGGNPGRLTGQMILDGLEDLRNRGFLQDQRVKHICLDDNDFTPD